MSTTARVGSAVAAGYLLGRFKKLRLALVVGSALANKDVRNSGKGLLQRGGVGLGTGGLTQQVKSQLMEAGKAAAVSVAASKINSISDRLQERSESMRGGSASKDDDEEVDDVRDEDEDLDEEDEDEDVDEGDEDVDEPTDEEEDQEGDEVEDEESDDEDVEPEDEYDDEEPEDEYEEPQEEPQEEPEHARRSSRRRRTAAPVGGGA